MANRVIDLVLPGGGIKAVAYVGGVAAIEEKDIEIRKIAAVSAGAFVAVGIGVGYSASELMRVVFDTDFSKFAGPVLHRAQKRKNHRKPPRGKLFKEHFVFEKLRTKKGIDDGQAVMDWTSNLLKNKGYGSDTTFSDLPKDVRMVAYDHTRKGELVFSRERTPNALVVEAVRASTGLVPIYEPFRWTDDNGRAHELTDGGVVNLYPIDIFDKDKDRGGLPPTIGLRMTEGLPEEGDGEVIAEKRSDVDNEEEDQEHEESFFEYLIDHIIKSIDTQGNYVVRRSHSRRSVNIYSGNIRTIDFLTIGNDDRRKEWLVKQGYDAAREYLDYAERFLFFPDPLYALFFEIKNLGSNIRNKSD